MVDPLLTLQTLYFTLGMAYNGVSQWRLSQGRTPLASTSPVVGAVVMLAYAVSLGLGVAGLALPYRVAMVPFVIIGATSGTTKHLRVYRERPEAYASRGAWLAAIAINSFGLLCNGAVLLGA